jgi:hypothetical protein
MLIFLENSDQALVEGNVFPEFGRDFRGIQYARQGAMGESYLIRAEMDELP